jgi:hypothetical protein
VDAVRKLWDVQAEPTRKALGAAYLQELLEAAEAFDEQRKLAASGEGAQLDDLNSQVLGGGTGGSE